LKAQALKEEQARRQRQAEIERLLKAADLAIEWKDWELAQEKLGDVLRLEAGHLDARSKLDIVQRKMSEREREREAEEKQGVESKEQAERARLAAEEKKKTESREQAERARRAAEEKQREEKKRAESRDQSVSPAGAKTDKPAWLPYGIGGAVILALACLVFGGGALYRAIFPQPGWRR